VCTHRRSKLVNLVRCGTGVAPDIIKFVGGAGEGGHMLETHGRGEAAPWQKREPIVMWGRQALCRRGEMGFCGVIVTNVPQRQQINSLIV
jgi:hypothetical protein